MTDDSTSATHRLEVPATTDESEPLVARLWAAGALGVWERHGTLVAWFRERPHDLGIDGTWSLEPDRDWLAEWRATVRPVRAGLFTVVPSWLATDDDSADPAVIVLDPGRAFGSGHHATTAMCLELLDELDLEGVTVADIGCGSGVLAIAAARRGARVVAVDVDPQAIATTQENADRNDVALDVRLGSVDTLTEPVEVVVANLVSELLVRMAEPLVRSADAQLIVSGIAQARGPEVTSALERAGASVAVRRERDGWLALRAESSGTTATSASPTAARSQGNPAPDGS